LELLVNVKRNKYNLAQGLKMEHLEDYRIQVNKLNSYWEAVKDIIDGRQPTKRWRI